MVLEKSPDRPFRRPLLVLELRLLVLELRLSLGVTSTASVVTVEPKLGTATAPFDTSGTVCASTTFFEAFMAFYSI
jgi:hypothetical protein